MSSFYDNTCKLIFQICLIAGPGSSWMLWTRNCSHCWAIFHNFCCPGWVTAPPLGAQTWWLLRRCHAYKSKHCSPLRLKNCGFGFVWLITVVIQVSFTPLETSRRMLICLIDKNTRVCSRSEEGSQRAWCRLVGSRSAISTCGLLSEDLFVWCPMGRWWWIWCPAWRATWRWRPIGKFRILVTFPFS